MGHCENRLDPKDRPSLRNWDRQPGSQKPSPQKCVWNLLCPASPGWLSRVWLLRNSRSGCEAPRPCPRARARASFQAQDNSLGNEVDSRIKEEHSAQQRQDRWPVAMETSLYQVPGMSPTVTQLGGLSQCWGWGFRSPCGADSAIGH
jgi:hypothetical protein